MKLFFRWIALALALVLCGCGAQEMKEEMPAQENALTYQAEVFFESDGLLVPVAVELNWSDDMAAQALNCMVPSEETKPVLEEAGLSAPLPGDARFTLSIQDGTAMVDLVCESLDQTDQTRCTLIKDAIVNTLCSFPGIDAVLLTVGGSEKLGKSDLSETMSRQCLNIESKSKEGTPVSLYFKTNDSGMLVPVTRYLKNADAAEVAAQLVAGPKNSKKLMNIFPQGTKLLSATLNGDTLTLDFSKEFSKLSEDSRREAKLLGGISRTFSELENVKTVVICVEGVPYEGAEETTMARYYNQLDW